MKKNPTLQCLVVIRGMMIRKTILKPVFAVLFIDLLLCLREASKKNVDIKAKASRGGGQVMCISCCKMKMHLINRHLKVKSYINCLKKRSRQSACAHESFNDFLKCSLRPISPLLRFKAPPIANKKKLDLEYRDTQQQVHQCCQH